MTSTPGTPWPPRPTGARRDHRLRDRVDALGFPLVPLTLHRSRRIVIMRKADNSIGDERAGTPRLALVCAAGSVGSPLDFGGSSMSRDHRRFAPSRAGRLGGVAKAASAFLVLALTAGLWLGGPARAQETRIIYPGSMAVTGFSGTVIPDFDSSDSEKGGLPPGVDPIDETFIDTARATLRVFDVSSLGGPASGQLVYTPPPFEVTSGQIGQVFGLTYDDGMRDGAPSGVPNLYAGATSLHGIRIVTPDADDDGRPERQHRGMAGAAFMEGQFGTENGGGPGTIWKVDGITGQVAKFADIDTNSGPGIGNLTFDPIHHQVFASDLDTGLIHRIDPNGALVDTFDHGVAGRPAHGLAPVTDDGAVMDIQGAAFDTEDPETWGYTQDERRVWAVAYHGGRLYYSVGEKAEIWSVGIARDGRFAGDPRWELTVKADKDYAVTDIAFDDSGFMYLAQRGPVENRYDYSQLADSGKGEVIRYFSENPDDPATESVWVEAPQEYAVGFPQGFRQSAGGLDLQYGYDAEGDLDTSACTRTLVNTGDKLRDNPALAERLAAGGPLAVHGVQITPRELVKPANVPPFGSRFVDFDGYFEDPEVEGHVGDVAVWHPCEGRAGYYEEIPGGYLPPFYPPDFQPPGNLPPCLDVDDVRYFCTPRGLEADLYLHDHAGLGGDSIKAQSRTPGVGVTSPMSHVPGKPYTIGITGHDPGDTVDVGLCFYRKSDKDKGGYYPCCKMTLPLRTPAVSCDR
ncbi:MULTISPECIES: hypothetical protein [unclassified Mesorhizobium]|uniref:hypothetical protein n=2 Tax=Mesorhizobium TaxID=68287 RepID=UPI0011289C19|nr:MULTISPECIES: hypothetical protein [unclassified Mesorhizobium]TPK61424.1 hypothetical protein FJ551_20185 [Mesorhizobium sp. B2-5-1]TPM66651.1 hypothetical protein FJ962_01335 [Mesorhizobium sp. B2-1-9]TPM89045.1 hypothetical protein FJ963_02040 [Mesorhizobium sp. B2-1-4]TPN08953.1 hypothetical protein FJ971_18850 [Mesorhizobium sp. B2-1-2]UCI13882.1 hypothetical protein FJ972_03115 [Mesorhizobium sp. B2-1-1]